MDTNKSTARAANPPTNMKLDELYGGAFLCGVCGSSGPSDEETRGRDGGAS